MAENVADTSPLDPDFFEDRFLIAIKSWDWPLFVGLSPDSTPPEYRFQGGLHHVRGFEIDGEIVAPKAYRGRAVRVWISPFGKDVRFGPDHLPEVGRFFFRYPETGRDGFSLSLHLPEDAVPTTATCLASVWKYLHVWIFDPDAEQASVRSFSFSANYHENLDSWVNAD